jgi:hypothetical protein
MLLKVKNNAFELKFALKYKIVTSVTTKDQKSVP